MSYGTYSHHYIFEYVYIRDEFGLFSEPDDFKDFVETYFNGYVYELTFSMGGMGQWTLSKMPFKLT